VTASSQLPHQVRWWLQKGLLATRVGDHAQARRCFQAARKADPDNIVALLHLAWLAPTRYESLVLLSRVMELDPKNKRARAGIRWARRRPPSEKEHALSLTQSPGYEAQGAGAARNDIIGAYQLSVAETKLSSAFSVIRGWLYPPKATKVVRAREESFLGRYPVPFITPLGLLNVALRFAWGLLSVLLLLVVLTFFVALAIDLGRQGGLSGLSPALPSATTFTVGFFSDLVIGNWDTVHEMARALPKSLGLLATALIVAVLVGLPLGVGAALRRTARFSGLLLFVSTLGISTPSFFAAMLLVWFAVWLYRTTGADFLPVYGFGWDAHLVFPSLVLAARPTANVMRLGYNALAEVIDADFVRTARAKGLRPRTVFVRHVLRNAGVPLLTTTAVSLRFSLAVLPVVEYIFNWPGVGLGLLQAIQTGDTGTVVSMVLPLALLFVLVNQLLEVVYRLVDPRLRLGEVGAV
jgi:ABC-type dipeptide/oligopeptide/nickel transport system permease component